MSSLNRLNRKLDVQREKDWRDNMAFKTMLVLIEKKDMKDIDVEEITDLSLKLTDKMIERLNHEE